MTRKPYKIHKPTHKWFDHDGTPALCIGQMRGDVLYLNRYDKGGRIVEKTRAVGTCAEHLTGYGQGFGPDESAYVRRMQGAWAYMFGADVPAPIRCETVTK